jgi:hypothetical protein
VVWSRPVERSVREPDLDALAPQALPAAWRDAIQRTPASVLRPEADETGQVPVGPEPVAADVEVDEPIQERVIQPSPFSLSRYRRALESVEPDRLDPESEREVPADLDFGGGI